MTDAEELSTPTWHLVKTLRAEIDRLNERLSAQESNVISIREQEAAIAKRVFGIWPQQARVLMRLYRGRQAAYVTIGQLLSAAYGEMAEERSEINLKVIIHKLRKRLGAGVIATEWGQGYRLTEEGVRCVERAFHRKHGRAA